MKYFRIILCILLLFALAFSPRYLIEQSRRDFFAEVRRREPPSFVGTLVLYHIVSERTYAGSVTAWLQTQADAYGKKHKGTHILVEGMTEPLFWERIEYGRVPDGYSFFSGTLPTDRLREMETKTCDLRDGLADTAYAVPYFYSGYARLSTEQKSVSLPAQNDIAAMMASQPNGDVKNKMPIPQTSVVTDLRAAGDALRNEQYGESYAVEPVGNYTASVCWLGIQKGIDNARAEALQGFYDYVRSQSVQQKLGTLGAMSVLAYVEDAVPHAAMKDIYAGYQTVMTPDPFRLQAEKDTLISDAALALNGDEDAERRFQSRMQEVLLASACDTES